jgi:hypothetical protein
MSLETFARQYWLASSFLKGRRVAAPMTRVSAESCLRELGSRCRWNALRRAARGSAVSHRLFVSNAAPAETLLPCDTEPEVAP